MTSSLSQNISLEKPSNGSDVGTWDVPVNADWDVIDAVFGNTTTINAVAATGTVALTLTQYRPRIITINGALTSSVNYQFPSGIGGTWSIGNFTSGAFIIFISSAGAGTTISINQGSRALVCCDGTNVFLADTSSSVPVGLISLWSGSIATIPTNWNLCDGTNGTVDLRDKFIVGAGNTYSPGNTGGAASSTPTITVGSHVLAQTELPSYNLPVTDPAHIHGLLDAGHNHTVGGAAQVSGTFIYQPGGSSAAAATTTTLTTSTSTTGATIQAAFTGITVGSGGSGNGHVHPGSSTAVPTLPPYYALAFIQKIA